jgi:AcrR family transcriptional regulator
VREPAYTRLDVDERRRQLLELGGRLFMTHSYSELSMAASPGRRHLEGPALPLLPLQAGVLPRDARPGRRRAPGADRADARADGVRAARGQPGRLPVLDRDPRQAYEKLLRTSLEVDEVRELVEEQRELFAAGSSPGSTPEPASRTAVRGWLWSIDGVCLDWIGHRDLSRAQVHGILHGTLLGALGAAAAT